MIKKHQYQSFVQNIHLNEDNEYLWYYFFFQSRVSYMYENILFVEQNI